MVKVFISHQQADSVAAGAIARRLSQVHQIPFYLDVIDPAAHDAGNTLGEHVRDELGKCTQLLAVVSSATKTSWWVPWEIGIATEKDYPLATFANDPSPLPEYLRKWPYLRTESDLDKYANASKVADQNRRSRTATVNESFARRTSTADFFKSLRASLGQ